MLATTRNYLMVLKTMYKDPKSGKELCGFTSKMGANAPAPRLLRLKTGAFPPRPRWHGASCPALQGTAGQCPLFSAPCQLRGNAPDAAALRLGGPAPAVPSPVRPRCTPAEDVKLTKGAPLEKGHFTWITERGRQERWIVASCGTYTVLWNFRWVSIAVALPPCLARGLAGQAGLWNPCMLTGSRGIQHPKSPPNLSPAQVCQDCGARGDVLRRPDHRDQVPPRAQGRARGGLWWGPRGTLVSRHISFTAAVLPPLSKPPC